MRDIADQYRIIATAAGWIDRGDRGRLSFEGRDAASFLQALVTNDVAPLVRGTGVYAAYLTPQGRMIADLRLFHRGDRILAEVAPGLGAGLATRFDHLVFSEDVRVTDVTDATAVVRVAGHGAAALVAAWLGVTEPGLAALDPLAQIDAAAGGEAEAGPGRDAFAVRADDVDVPAFDVWLPRDGRDAFVAWLSARHVAALATELMESLRVNAGRPAFGVDMTEETIPLEAGLQDRAISTSKGCYVGQEVIIRVLHRGGGRVAKRLMRLAFEMPGDGVPAPGTAIVTAGGDGAVTGREVGRVTSVSRLPVDGRASALGYIARDVVDAGLPVAIGATAATVIGPAG